MWLCDARLAPREKSTLEGSNAFKQLLHHLEEEHERALAALRAELHAHGVDTCVKLSSDELCVAQESLCNGKGAGNDSSDLSLQEICLEVPVMKMIQEQAEHQNFLANGLQSNSWPMPLPHGDRPEDNPDELAVPSERQVLQCPGHILWRTPDSHASSGSSFAATLLSASPPESQSTGCRSTCRAALAEAEGDDKTYEQPMLDRLASCKTRPSTKHHFEDRTSHFSSFAKTLTGRSTQVTLRQGSEKLRCTNQSQCTKNSTRQGPEQNGEGESATHKVSEKFLPAPAWERHTTSVKANAHFQLRIHQVTESRPDEIHFDTSNSLGRRQSSQCGDETLMKLPRGKRTKKCWRFLGLSPNSRVRISWDFMSLALVCYDMIVIPLQFFDLPASEMAHVMAWVTRSYWSTDIPLSFISGFVMKDGIIEMRPRRIAFRYIRTWLLLDVCIVGFDWTEVLMEDSGGYAQMGRASRIFRLARMIRLLRLIRLMGTLSNIVERIYSEKLIVFIDLMKLTISVLAFSHLLACIWYGIGTVSVPDAESWASKYQFVSASLSEKYTISLHWSLSQFTGGMDQITPENSLERLFAIIMFICAFVGSALFVSRITSMLTQLNLVGMQQSSQLHSLRRYLYQNGISRRLAVRVIRNAMHTVVEQQRLMPEDKVEMLAWVSEPLHVEIHFEMYAPVVAVHPFFKAYILECQPVMKRICHMAIDKERLTSGDIVFHAGERPTNPKMFFVVQGELEYNCGANQGSESTQVSEKQWISEHNLWVVWVHRGTFTAKVDCMLATIDAKKFQAIVLQFDHNDFDPGEYAREFVNTLNSERHQATDLGITKDANLSKQRTLSMAKLSTIRRTMKTKLSSSQSSGFI